MVLQVISASYVISKWKKYKIIDNNKPRK